MKHASRLYSLMRRFVERSCAGRGLSGKPAGLPAATLLAAVVAVWAPTDAVAGPGSWTTGGPYGGFADAIAVSPSDPATLYAAVANSGLFKSTDAGGTWAPLAAGIRGASVTALTIDPSTPATLYAGGVGVLKSTDAGATWFDGGLPGLGVYALTIHPSTPTTLYAGASSGLYRSTDSGGTWAHVNMALLYVMAVALHPSAPATIYAGTYFAGVFKSTDAGATWAPANTGLTNLSVNALNVDPTSPTTLYAGTSGGVFRSTNSGATWDAVNTGLTHTDVYRLAVSRTSPTTLYAGTQTGGIYRSTDSGSTWAAANAGLTSLQVSAVAVNPVTPTTIYASVHSGVFKSTNSGGTWAPVSANLTGVDVLALLIHPTTPTTVYAAGPYGVFKSTNSGEHWSATGLAFGTVLVINRSNPATLYAGVYGGGVFKSTDSGATWAPINTGLTNPYVDALAIDPVTPATLYAGTYYAGVFKSTNSGSTWAAANTGLAMPSVQAMAIDSLNPTTLYAGNANGSVFKSTDSGLNWTPANAGLAGRPVQALAINPAAPATLYAATAGGGIFKSTDAGSTWVAANTGITNLNVYSLTVNSLIPTTLYAGTAEGGVFKSVNSGGTWAPVNTGLPPLTVKALALDPTGPTTLYAGLSWGSVWQYTPPASVAAFVPIVLDVTGFAHYTSELQITNLGANPTTVTLSYTGSIGTGSGSAQVIVPAGQQVVYPDAISYLRTAGVPIGTSGNQGGTLLLASSAPGIHATLRTGADTVAPQPVGRSGLAYSDFDPGASNDSTKAYIYGLRTSDADRSNLTVYNMGQNPVSLKVTVISGDDGRSFEVTAGVPLVLPAYGWYQYSGVLNATGFSSGYAIIERVTGSGPFGAYGVVNDQMTNDGSFIPAQPGTLSGSRLTIPVLVETGAFESELILTNRGGATATFTLRYFESISPAKGSGGTATVDVAAGRQMIIPKAIDFLRSKGISIGARGETGYGGVLQVQVSGVGLENVFAGARTSSLSPAGGEFGVFYPGIGSSQEFSELAFLLGLKADVNNRSNVAVLHTGDGTSGPITLELQVLDGSEGGKAVGQPLSVTLNPGQWAQPAGFFASGGVPNGYVRIRRTAGTAPWYAYGVINDGGQPGQRTGDGSYVPGVQP